MASQSRTAISLEVEARILPPGEKATALIRLWPRKLWRSSARFQTPVVASWRTVLSSAADARTLPSGEKATALTGRL